jgi:hypothetical protein
MVIVQAKSMTDMLVTKRADYLAKRGEEIGATVETNPNLEDWFRSDPVERIVNLENSIHSRKREIERLKAGPDAPRPVSPGIR